MYVRPHAHARARMHRLCGYMPGALIAILQGRPVNLSVSTPRVAATGPWAPFHLQQANFTLGADETTLDLRVVTDRSIVEVFAAGGRGVVSVSANPPLLNCVYSSAPCCLVTTCSTFH